MTDAIETKDKYTDSKNRINSYLLFSRKLIFFLMFFFLIKLFRFVGVYSTPIIIIIRYTSATDAADISSGDSIHAIAMAFVSRLINVPLTAITA